MKIKCLADLGVLTKGTSYDVVGMGSTTAMVLDDDGKIVSVPFADINAGEAWEVDDEKSDKRNQGKSK